MSIQHFSGRTRKNIKCFAQKDSFFFCNMRSIVLLGALMIANLSLCRADEPENIVIGSDSLSQRNVGLDEVVVVASRSMLTQMQSAKIVSVITREDIQHASVQTVNDVLKMATGVDVRQRGGFGVQTDISIDGGTFDQIAILLNGVNISSPQTGHNAADFPVSLSDIERIEVLEGAAARVIGSSAFCGAINIVTSSPESSEVRLSAEGGMYGTYGADASANYATSQIRNIISGGYTKSDGAIENGDFIKRRAFYQGSAALGESSFHWQAGWSSQDFGANTFYSAKFNNQYEETRRLIGSVNGNIKVFENEDSKLTIAPQLSWHRDYDHYQLIRGEVGTLKGENYHRTDVLGAGMNANADWMLGKTSFGVDVSDERILSTALGDEMEERIPVGKSDRFYEREGKRLNTNLFVEHTVLLENVSLSLGAMANRNTGLDSKFRFYPGVDVSWRPDNRWKCFASYNKALRLPTYTDLYINNSVQYGDIHLLPEKNATYKLGVQYLTQGIRSTVSAFYSHGEDMIDWVYETAESTRYHALNIGQLDNRGVSVDVNIGLREFFPTFFVSNVKMGYAFIDQSHESQKPIFRSLYALEYLRHKVVAQVDHSVWKNLSASWNFRWQQRMNGFAPYGKLDCKLMWHAPKYEIYLKGDNLTNHRYYDIGGVLQPGLWVMAGFALRL